MEGVKDLLEAPDFGTKRHLSRGKLRRSFMGNTRLELELTSFVRFALLPETFETREFLQAQQHVPSATTASANFPIRVLAGTILWHYLPRKHLPLPPSTDAAHCVAACVGISLCVGSAMKRADANELWMDFDSKILDQNLYFPIVFNDKLDILLDFLLFNL